MKKLDIRMKTFLFISVFTLIFIFNGNNYENCNTRKFFITATIISDNGNVNNDENDEPKYIEGEYEKSSEKYDEFLEDIRGDGNFFVNSPIPDKDLPKFGEPLQNVTIPIGRDAILQCIVDNLQTYKIAWLRVDTQTILTIQTHVITKNHRMSITHSEKRAWILKIRDVKESDKGWYMCQINTDPMKNQVGYLDVVVPPDILDYPSSSDMVIREGSNVTLKCAATGSPLPTITWRREDGSTIPLSESDGIKNVNSYNGSTLVIAKVNRLNMGAYLCIATNGVPPSVSKRIMLIVHFPPMIWIQNQLVGAAVGQTITLECQSEAYPKSINYWMKNDTIIVPGEKFIPEMYERLYKVIMKLTIVNVEQNDFVTYKCLAKNSLGDTDGAIKLYNIPRITTTTSTTISPLTTYHTSTNNRKSESTGGRYSEDKNLKDHNRRNKLKNRRKHKSYTILDDLTFSSSDDLENFQQISNLWNSKDETYYRNDDPTNSTIHHTSYGGTYTNSNIRKFFKSSSSSSVSLSPQLSKELFLLLSSLILLITTTMIEIKVLIQKLMTTTLQQKNCHVK
ncbi:neurotrimin-like [Condylostylus longicornis]|uniref:neurotrimin-like n=1 Tax=Condylostylus longicornis TaxID=2530218 RepID=UPI00244DEE9E|nr:neurotrimin-like [Condylostylus longicornis]